MMEEETPHRLPPLGLWELDEQGTVLYYRPNREEKVCAQTAEVVGRKFFGEIVFGGMVEELRAHLLNFKAGHAPAQSINLTIRNGDGTLPARILLARIHEQTVLGSAESILVHIRRA